MRISLLWKLVLAFMLIAVITAGSMAIFIRETSTSRLTNLIITQQGSSFSESLKIYYSTNGSWNGLQREWDKIQFTSLPGTSGAQVNPPADKTSLQPSKSSDPNVNPADRRIMPRDRRNLFGLVDQNGLVVIQPVKDFAQVGQKAPQDSIDKGIPIFLDDKLIGTLLLPSVLPSFLPEEQVFIARTNQALVFAILGATVIALIMGVVLARTLTLPLQALTQAAQAIADGQLDQQVVVRSKDEIGQLAASFNLMSQAVARANQLRKQMTADIAHDLRTPLTVIGGYIESMRDGVLKPTTERMSLVYDEVERLQDLVGDLRMLSQADAGELPLHPQLIDPRSILERAAAIFQHSANQKGVRLAAETGELLPEVMVDEARMLQVFDNLISNSMRYTPKGGKIILSGHRQDAQVVLAVRDTGSGIEEQDLPYIFDRFHRADSSRHTDHGESGLGLAIVKALVEAQGGSVAAQSTVGEGTIISIRLPIPSQLAG
jgi:signal transduction histidine kinase